MRWKNEFTSTMSPYLRLPSHFTILSAVAIIALLSSCERESDEAKLEGEETVARIVKRVRDCRELEQQIYNAFYKPDADHPMPPQPPTGWDRPLLPAIVVKGYLPKSEGKNQASGRRAMPVLNALRNSNENLWPSDSSTYEPGQNKWDKLRTGAYEIWLPERTTTGGRIFWDQHFNCNPAWKTLKDVRGYEGRLNNTPISSYVVLAIPMLSIEAAVSNSEFIDGNDYWIHGFNAPFQNRSSVVKTEDLWDFDLFRTLILAVPSSTESSIFYANDANLDAECFAITKSENSDRINLTPIVTKRFTSGASYHNGRVLTINGNLDRLVKWLRESPN